MWMDLEGITLSKIQKYRKGQISYDLTYIWYLRNKTWPALLYGRNQHNIIRIFFLIFLKTDKTKTDSEIRRMGPPRQHSGKESTCQYRRQETWVQSLGREDPLEEGMATHSSILAWRSPWTEEPGGLQSIGLQRVRRDWETEHAHIRTQTQRTTNGCFPEGREV